MITLTTRDERDWVTEEQVGALYVDQMYRPQKPRYITEEASDEQLRSIERENVEAPNKLIN